VGIQVLGASPRSDDSSFIFLCSGDGVEWAKINLSNIINICQQ
jgi:hypothetical protein